jgi:hypothetical protein
VCQLHICVGERELILEADVKEAEEWKKAVQAVIDELGAPSPPKEESKPKEPKSPSTPRSPRKPLPDLTDLTDS